MTRGLRRRWFQRPAIDDFAADDGGGDFEVGVDKIALLPSIFGAIGTSLSKGEFFLGNKAHDKNDHIIYNEKNGKLFYDDDGKGGDAKVQIATLDKHLELTHHDYQLIEI